MMYRFMRILDVFATAIVAVLFLYFMGAITFVAGAGLLDLIMG